MTADQPRRRRRSGAAAAWLVLLLVAASVTYAVWLARTSTSPEASAGATSGPGTTASSTTRGGPGSTTGAPGPTAAQPATPTDEQGCTPATADGIPQQPGAAEPLPDKATATAQLAALRVAPRSHADTYCRWRFGPPTWPDLDRNGCTTRQDVLVRAATAVRTARIASHGGTCLEAISGTWTDPYTLQPITLSNLKDSAQAQQLQIDHLVPLYNAWVSGASEWTDDLRVRFANDLAAPELRAVAGAVNFAKDRSGPETWQPVTAARCDYARAYVAVKSRYALTVTVAERNALAEMLNTCP